MTKQHRNKLIAQLATLEQRLNRGWEMQGDEVDAHFEKLLRRYEAIYDELRDAGHV